MNSADLKFFDEIAPKWDSMEIKSTGEKINELLDQLSIRAGERVLDLGTGTGVLVPYLSERVGETGLIVAVDGSEGMLAQARRKYGHLENVDFVHGDFEEDVIEGTYDLIMLYCVYPHLRTPYDTLKWLKKVNLNAGGRIVIAFPSDENFINHVHGDVEAHSHLLPSARDLADEFLLLGFTVDYAHSDPERYMVIIR